MFVGVYLFALAKIDKCDRFTKRFKNTYSDFLTEREKKQVPYQPKRDLVSNISDISEDLQNAVIATEE